MRSSRRKNPLRPVFLALPALCISALGVFLWQAADTEPVRNVRVAEQAAVTAPPPPPADPVPASTPGPPEEAAPPPPELLPATGGGRIEGQILSVTGSLAAGAEVQLRGMSGLDSCSPPPEADVTSTGPDGSFLFEGVAFSRYAIVALDEAGLAAHRVVELTPTRPAAQVVLTLAEAGHIAGKVVTAQGAPVAGAVLQPVGFEGEGVGGAGHAVTDGTGAFALNPLQAGAWQLAVCAPGYAMITTDWLTAPRDHVVIVLPAPERLHGRVVAQDTGEGLSGLTVEARPEAQRNARRTATTDAGGHFEFNAFGLESVRLAIASKEFVLPGDRGQTLVRPADSPILLELVRCGVVLGTFYDASGAPAAGYEVSTPGGGLESTIRSNVTGDDGRYEIQGVLPGSAELTPARQGQPLGLPGMLWVDLGPGAVVEGADFHLSGGRVRGSVRYANGLPAEGARVTLHTGDMFIPELYAFADTEGEYLVDGVDPSWLFRMSAATARASSAQSEPFRVAEGREQRVDLELGLENEAILAGIVRDRQNRPARGSLQINVNVAGQAAGEIWTRTDSGGSFAVFVPPLARLDFLFQPNPVGADLIPGAPPEPASYQFDVKTFQPPLHLRVQGVPDEVKLGGRVVDQEGHPLMVTVGAKMQDEPMTRGAMTDKDGRFAYYDLADGTYDVFTSHNGGTARIEDVPTGTADLVLQVLPRPAISGFVLDAQTGEAIHQFSYRVFPADIAGTPSPASFTPYSSADGSFQITPDRSGGIRLCCHAPGYQLQCLELNVAEGGQRLEVVFELQAE